MSGDVAVIEYRDEDTGTVFRWHGGAYIDVGYETPKKDIDAPAPASIFRAEDVINVWNDELDESWFESDAEIKKMAGAYVKRPFRYILEAFEQRCRDYLAETYAEQDA